MSPYRHIPIQPARRRRQLRYPRGLVVVILLIAATWYLGLVGFLLVSIPAYWWYERQAKKREERSAFDPEHPYDNV